MLPLSLSLSRLDFLVILGWQWSASRGVVRFHPGLSSPYRIWASPPHLPCLPPPSLCVCVCVISKLGTWAPPCVCVCVCLCTELGLAVFQGVDRTFRIRRRGRR